MKLIALAMLLAMIPGSALGARKMKEAEYQDKYCIPVLQGQEEFILPDDTRIDCLTNEIAYEFDFANKWAEGVGQALFYGAMTGRRAGLVLILESETDSRFLKRALFVNSELNLNILIIPIMNYDQNVLEYLENTK